SRQFWTAVDPGAGVCLPHHLGRGMIAAMPRCRADPLIPDLFSAATARNPLPLPATQISSPKGAVEEGADIPLHRHVLPKDLPHALKQLDDRELESLLAAALDEAKQRDRLPPGLEVKSAGVGKASPKSDQAFKARQGHSAALSLTRGQVNAVRAAFR